MRASLDEARDRRAGGIRRSTPCCRGGHRGVLVDRARCVRDAARRHLGSRDGRDAGSIERGGAAPDASLDGPLRSAERLLAGFRAAPLSREEQLQRAGQLDRFLRLVPIEYGRGVRDGQVVLDFEIQEAITFRDGAAGAFRDLEPTCSAVTPPPRGGSVRR